MSTKAWYPFFWSDYSGKTLSLTMQEHGAYILLLRYIYTNEKSVPAKHCYSIARAVTKAERASLDKVLEFFFIKDRDGNFYNGRAFEVIEQQAEKYERRATAGKKGGLSKSASRSNAKPMLKQPEPEPEPVSKAPYREEKTHKVVSIGTTSRDGDEWGAK